MGSDEYISQAEFRRILDDAASNNPHVVVVLDADSGNDGWTDRDNTKHIAMLATHVGEQANLLSRRGGIFTIALNSILKNNGNGITYRQLYQAVFEQGDRACITTGKMQTPKFYMHEESWDTLFLTSKKWNPDQEVQNLLQQFGYTTDDMGFEKNILFF